jgi:hypothetical protein
MDKVHKPGDSEEVLCPLDSDNMKILTCFVEFR